MGRKKKVKPEIQFFPAQMMENLRSIRSYPLTLLEAPSGFGKTTALRHFFDVEVSKTAAVFWHTCFPASPGISWKAFCEGIGLFDPPSARRLLALGPPDEDNLADVGRILRELHCPEETYLVLDDFAAWNLPSPGDFLTALSGHSGASLHIVIATQILPREVRENLLPSRRFSWLREHVLAFCREDIDSYFRKAGIDLTEGQLAEVSDRTEGWIIALYLQMLSFIANGSFEAGDLENLMQKALWDHLPEQEREILLAVSIFPRFSLAQATAFSGLTAAETEGFLRERRVFVHFDRETRHFYFHSLFHAFLRERFLLLPEARRRATYLLGGDLAEKAGDRINTLRFYYESGVWERFFALPLTSYEIADIVDEETKPMILDILDHTPMEIKKKYPGALVPLAFTLFFLHENEKLLSLKDEIYDIIAAGDLAETEKNALFGEMELLLSFLAYNRIEDMSAHHRKALTLLGGAAGLINLKSTWTFGSPSVLFLFHREAGRLDAELTEMDACMPIYYRLTNGHGSGAEIIMRAEAHFLRGEVEEAEILCHRALFTADSKGQNSIYICGLFLLARIATLRGDSNLLADAIRSLEDRCRLHREDLGRYTLDLAKGFIDLLLRNRGALPAWITAGEINEKRLVVMAQPFAHILYGRYLLEQGEYGKLIGVCQYFLQLSSIFPNLLPQIYGHLYLAQAYFATGKQEEALTALKNAVDIAFADGIYMPFAENFPGLQALLPTVCGAERRKEREAIEALAQALEEAEANLGSQKSQLTPRELEVIALVRQNLSNREIAETLFVSVSTIKTLLGRIYRKTGTSSKTQLVMLDL